MLPNGQLNIPNSDDSDDDLEPCDDIEKDYRLMLSNFERQSLTEPKENPWVRKEHHRPLAVRKELKEKATKNERKQINNDTKEQMDEISIEDTDDEEVSILNDFKVNKCHNKNNREELFLFRPFNQYWMYRCDFKEMLRQSMRMVERDFPANFRWLLHECAHIIEMHPEELYEEVCYIERYQADVLYPSDDPEWLEKYNLWEYRRTGHQKLIEKHWQS